MSFQTSSMVLGFNLAVWQKDEGENGEGVEEEDVDESDLEDEDETLLRFMVLFKLVSSEVRAVEDNIWC